MLILLAEDDEISRTVMESLLTKWGHEVLIAEDGGTASRMIESGIEFDVAILDWMMPERSGIEVCKELRAQPREPRPYVMMLTAKGTPENIATGLDAGADDYLLKPFEAVELAARLRVALRQNELQQSLIVAREQVRFASTHDVCTSVLNRGALLEALGAAVAKASREQRLVSVLSLDVDGFSGINAAHGQRAGDDVLREVAARVRGVLARDCVIGRSGADEFCCVLPDVGPARAEAVAAQVQQSISGLPIIFEWGSVSVSVSVAVATAGANADLGTLLTALDAAAFAARQDQEHAISVAAMVA
ncbi:MAG: diguanylate cyclase [Deltaproteobacteria bacterium]|nr:diguanylate cyclase [Deltaproteobacteria bacterium]